MRASVERAGFPENRDEHRRNILQNIFRFRFLEERGVLLQLVRHLINDETAAGRERLVRFPQKGKFLVDLKNTERDPGDNVITLRDAASLHFLRQMRCVLINHMDAGIVYKLASEIAREGGIDFE